MIKAIKEWFRVYKLNQRLEIQNEALSKRYQSIFDRGYRLGSEIPCPMCKEPRTMAAMIAMKEEYTRGYQDGIEKRQEPNGFGISLNKPNKETP